MKWTIEVILLIPIMEFFNNSNEDLFLLRTCPKTVQCGNSHKNLTIFELLESSQITKCDGFCRNYCVLLKISKELSCKFLRFWDKF
ncbi:hypothetical protein LeptoLang_18570 [Leptospira interrogans serovar Icterohaemorrhagiae]|nr:hypothetical protein LeptoLang_18570 [Leptospira interrogans serovar Icterohaemorrhagiae]